jgi:membrane protease YdiL (CAAX protease family)
MSLELKLLIPLGVIAAVIIGMRRYRGVAGIDFGLRSPAVGHLLLWLGVYAAWMLGSNAIINWRGPWDFAPWRSMPLAAAAGRVLAVGVLGPIAEELLFRGYLYARLAAVARIGIRGAIAITAVAWGGLHFSDSVFLLFLLLIDGLLLGAARAATKSVWVPVGMHLVWNLYAVW